MMHSSRQFLQFYLFFVIATTSVFGDYWQQWVEYDMDVFLNAEAKSLTSSSNLVYVNNSPDTLNQILMHLYPNAFNKGTIAEQVWIDYGAPLDPEKEWTGITINEVLLDSVALKFTIRDDTILDIPLPHDLLPGDTLRFSLDWNTKIHPHIDRSGWDAEQFDFAQWYPKFVVYDENGWHDDPFGDWGEFYGEFGNFTVNLNLPLEQIVGATGVVIDGDPGWSDVSVDTSRKWSAWVKEFREDRGKILANMDSSDRRQVSFFAEDVHDFAWLCSPDFVYEHGEWNGVDIHALFTSQVGESWTKDAVKWGISSIKWLSEKFGMYAWPQMTITKALLDGGMEYPMLIMDVSDSESLTVHEIGHNWFFGILGNDELDDPWLDEGFTSFQTRWYKEHHYPNNGYDITRDNYTQFEHDKLPRQMYQEAALKPVIRYMQSPANEPIATRSYDFSDYGSYRDNVYDKTSIMLDMLKNYLGEDRFLAGMRLYYSRWALKHVNEKRFVDAMEEASREELDWFFDQWLHTTHFVNYKLTDWNVSKHDQDHFTSSIKVENKGGMFVPISATLYGENGETVTGSLQEFRFRSHGTIEVESNFKPVRVYVDADNVFFDVDRRDNDSRRKSAFRYNYKGWDAYPDDRNLYLWKPLFGFNDDAGAGLGIQLKRVYRNTGNYVRCELDQNFGSGNMDASLAFSKQQVGLPFKGTWSGHAKVWRSMTHASLAYEMSWAKRFWTNPLHYLTLSIENTNAEHADLGPADAVDYTRFGFKYELQNYLWGGNYGFSASLYTSPGGLGGYGLDFSQISLMSSWQKNISYFKFNNRTNLLTNYGDTPEIIKTRIASIDRQNMYLDRLGSSLRKFRDADELHARYHLTGGGRMRGYSDSLSNIAPNYIWSNNTDITIRSIPHVPDLLDFGFFFDAGQYSDNSSDWNFVGDAGFALVYKPEWRRTSWVSTLLRPIKLKLELTVMRYEGSEWASTLDSAPWVFSISN